MYIVSKEENAVEEIRRKLSDVEVWIMSYYTCKHSI